VTGTGQTRYYRADPVLPGGPGNHRAIRAAKEITVIARFLGVLAREILHWAAYTHPLYINPCWISPSQQMLLEPGWDAPLTRSERAAWARIEKSLS
jgi:hypothetical protein